MATYKVLACEEKQPGWKVVTLQMSETSQQSDVSVNKVNKKGEEFSGFDAIAVGVEVKGELWQSSAGKWYLFAPKPDAGKPWKSGGGSAAIAKAQETKREDIKEAQERKNEAIALAGAMRDATLVSLAALRDTPFPTDDEFKAEWTKWVKFFLGAGDQPFI